MPLSVLPERPKNKKVHGPDEISEGALFIASGEPVYTTPVKASFRSVIPKEIVSLTFRFRNRANILSPPRT